MAKQLYKFRVGQGQVINVVDYDSINSVASARQ